MSIEEVQPRIYRIPSILGPAALRAVARRRRRAAPARRLRDRRDDRGARRRRRSRSSAARRPRSPTSSSRTRTSTTTAATRSCGGSRRRRGSARPRTTGRGSSPGQAISRERYGWYRGHGLDYDEATWAWLENAAGPDTPLDGTVPDGEMLDLGGIAVEVVALPGTLARASGRRAPRFAHGDRDGRSARARALHDRRRADQPAAVRLRRRLPRARSTACARSRPARLGTSHYAPIEGEPPSTAFLDATRRLRRRPRRVQSTPSSDAEPQPLEHYWRAADAALGPFQRDGGRARRARSPRTSTRRSTRGAPCARTTADGRVRPGPPPEHEQVPHRGHLTRALDRDSISFGV